MTIWAFQEHKPWVKEMLEEGYIDHMEIVSLPFRRSRGEFLEFPFPFLNLQARR